MKALGPARYDYRLDAHDRIEWVSDGWLAFALENGATDLTEERVLGRPIWDFIADDELRAAYRRIFAKTRTTGRAWSGPFRCDSPTLRRFMQLEVAWERAQALHLSGILLHVEPCEPVRLLDAGALCSDARVTMCGICKNLLIEPAGWIPLEEGIRLRSLANCSKRPRIRYEVCPDCRRAGYGIPARPEPVAPIPLS